MERHRVESSGKSAHLTREERSNITFPSARIEPCPVTGEAGHKNNIDERGYEKVHGLTANAKLRDAGPRAAKWKQNTILAFPATAR
jgi:hypothetical protein